MPPGVQVFAVCMAALCVLVLTAHWIFGICVLLIAVLMASAMVAGRGGD